MPASDAFTAYGFTSVPADFSKIAPATKSPKAIPIEDILPPSSPLVDRCVAYAKEKLGPDVWYHSNRVYSYGRAISAECFPQFNLVGGGSIDETWYLTTLFHDIGTVPEFLTATRLSYEFWAGYHALDVLQDTAKTGGAGIAPVDQAESVAEAIIRHQDVQDVGQITILTRLIQICTLLDNTGAHNDLVHPETIDNIVKAYPRKGWGACFSAAVKKENEYKPYTMISRVPTFADDLVANTKSGGLMAKYEV